MRDSPRPTFPRDIASTIIWYCTPVVKPRRLVGGGAIPYARPPMPVGDVMSVRVVAGSPKAEGRETIARVLAEGVGSVAVCRGGPLVGIFPEADVLRVAGEGSLF